MSSASLHFLSFTPKTLSSSSLFTSSSVKLPSKLTVSVSSSSSVNNNALQHHHQQQQRCSRFVRNVAISSEVEEEGDLDFSGPEAVEEQSFSADLKLFVGNLPFDVDSAALAGLFEQAGNVEMVEVIYDKITGRSRGFGFVTMSSIQEVEAAAQQFNGYEIQGRALRVNYGPPPPKKEYSSPRGSGGGGSYGSSNRVYVGNLAWGVDNDALEGLFSEQGKVIEARVVYDRETGRSRGFGFVTYGSSEEVNSAVQSLDGADLGGRTIRVSPAEDRPKRF